MPTFRYRLSEDGEHVIVEKRWLWFIPRYYSDTRNKLHSLMIKRVKQMEELVKLEKGIEIERERVRSILKQVKEEKLTDRRGNKISPWFKRGKEKFYYISCLMWARRAVPKPTEFDRKAWASILGLGSLRHKADKKMSVAIVAEKKDTFDKEDVKGKKIEGSLFNWSAQEISEDSQTKPQKRKGESQEDYKARIGAGKYPDNMP